MDSNLGNQASDCTYEIHEKNSVNIKHLTVVSLNVCGLKSKLNCPDFMNFLHDYDVICIQESRLDDVDKIIVPGYKIFTHNRKQIARYRSGGIALLVKEEYSPFIHVLKKESKLVFWFEISKQTAI